MPPNNLETRTSAGDGDPQHAPTHIAVRAPSGELAMLPCVQPSPPPKHTNLPSAEAYTLR